VKIGIAVDGSSQATAGVELVASLPLAGRDQVTVISVAEPPVLLSAAPFGHVPSFTGFIAELIEMSNERARQVADHAVERLIGLPCPATAVVRDGHPIETLERFAAEAHPGPTSTGRSGPGTSWNCWRSSEPTLGRSLSEPSTSSRNMGDTPRR
jgi:hypothetical protein